MQETRGKNEGQNAANAKCQMHNGRLAVVVTDWRSVNGRMGQIEKLAGKLANWQWTRNPNWSLSAGSSVAMGTGWGYSSKAGSVGREMMIRESPGEKKRG